jgi:DNA (cytosine-5)-methyltransferase 1
MEISPPWPGPVEQPEKDNPVISKGQELPRVVAEIRPTVIKWDIRNVPSLPKPRKRLADIVEDLPIDDPHWWNQKRTNYFMNQMSEKHIAQARAMIAGNSVSYATAFRRVRHGKSMAELRTDGIAGCLRTPQLT